MPRTKRRWISQLTGSYHIISRTVGGNIFFTDEEKEFLLKLLERLASGFFVQIHASSIMGNHFHILATGIELDAKKATEKELLRRYRLIYGKGAEPLWVPMIQMGLSFRILMVEQNDYVKGLVRFHRWCSIGLPVRNPKRAKRLLSPIAQVPGYKYSRKFGWYREFVYLSGGIEEEGKKSIPQEVVSEIIRCHRKFWIRAHFRFRVNNMSTGVAIGTQSFIASFQDEYKRKFIRPRIFLDGSILFATRVLRM